MEGNLPLKKGEFYIRELSVLQHEGILCGSGLRKGVTKGERGPGFQKLKC